jgi:hypothetical protein
LAGWLRCATVNGNSDCKQAHENKSQSFHCPSSQIVEVSARDFRSTLLGADAAYHMVELRPTAI